MKQQHVHSNDSRLQSMTEDDWCKLKATSYSLFELKITAVDVFSYGKLERVNRVLSKYANEKDLPLNEQLITTLHKLWTKLSQGRNDNEKPILTCKLKEVESSLTIKARILERDFIEFEKWFDKELYCNQFREGVQEGRYKISFNTRNLNNLIKVSKEREVTYLNPDSFTQGSIIPAYYKSLMEHLDP